MATGSAYKSLHATLTADTVDTVSLTGWTKYVRVVNTSASDLIYVTTDGSTPTVEGDNTYVVLPSSDLLLINEGVLPEPALGTSGSTVVKLISSGTPTYGVEKN